MSAKIVLSLVVLMLLAITQPANAAFFDDEGGAKWWMNESQWEKYTIWNSDNSITATDQNNRLEFSSNMINTTVDGSFIPFVSKWSLSLNSDFEISVGYHHNVHSSDNNSAYSALDFDLIAGHLDSTGPVYDFGISAVSGNDSATPLAGEAYAMTPYIGSDFDLTWPRSLSDGVFTATYSAALDRLVLLATEDGAITGNGMYVDNLRTGFNLNSLQLALVGGANGFSHSGDEVYFHDLNLKSGVVVTPEPVSMMLFGFGGAALAFARRRKQ
jgi:hypothetical protein